jgi:hypothetical protein
MNAMVLSWRMPFGFPGLIGAFRRKCTEKRVTAGRASVTTAGAVVAA